MGNRAFKDIECPDCECTLEVEYIPTERGEGEHIADCPVCDEVIYFYG